MLDWSQSGFDRGFTANSNGINHLLDPNSCDCIRIFEYSSDRLGWRKRAGGERKRRRDWSPNSEGSHNFEEMDGEIGLGRDGDWVKYERRRHGEVIFHEEEEMLISMTT